MPDPRSVSKVGRRIKDEEDKPQTKGKLGQRFPGTGVAGRRLRGAGNDFSKGLYSMPADVVRTVASGGGRKAMKGAGEVAAQHQWTGALKSVPKAPKPPVAVVKNDPTGHLVIRDLSPEEKKRHVRAATTANAVVGGVSGALIGSMVPARAKTMKAARAKFAGHIGGGAALGAAAQGALGHHAAKKSKYTLDVQKRFFSASSRRKLADKGEANADGSYPIKSKKDAKNAIRLAESGHGSPSDRASALRRAKDELSKADSYLDDKQSAPVRRPRDLEAKRQRRLGAESGAAAVGSGVLLHHGAKEVARDTKALGSLKGDFPRLSHEAEAGIHHMRGLKGKALLTRSSGTKLGGAAALGGAAVGLARFGGSRANRRHS